MNWLRTILDTIIVCIEFNGVVAFVRILEPKEVSVILPEGSNTPKKGIPEKNIKPVYWCCIQCLLDNSIIKS